MPRSSGLGVRPRRGVLLSLADIPPGGAAVSLLGRQHGKSVYRLSIHTRAKEVFEVAINVAEDMNFLELKEEVSWLLAAGAPRRSWSSSAGTSRSGASSPRSSSPAPTWSARQRGSCARARRTA